MRIPAPGPHLGLTATERERASLANYLAAVIADDKRELGFFRELSEQTARAADQQPRGFGTYLVPADVTAGPLPATGQRDMTTTTGPGGAYLVGAEIGGFVQALNAASIIGALPVTTVNMQANLTVTRETVKGSAGWLADEGVSQMPAAQPTFGQLALGPKTVAGHVVLSRQMLRQTGPAAQAFVDRALAVTVAEAVDAALLAGTGNSGQPLGILNTAGIDSRAGTSLTWADTLAMFKVADGREASTSAAWVAGVDAAEVLRKRGRATGSGFIAEAGLIDGRPLVVSRSAPAASLVVMPWSQCWMASWGALEIGADPMTHFRDGRVIVRCLWSVDFAVERAGSVAVATAVS